MDGKVPGPYPKPTKVAERRQALEYLDQKPFERPTQCTGTEADKEENSSLKVSIFTGAIARAFLRPLEGEEKSTARLGHQNEPNYIAQYFRDSKRGIVPGVKLCDIRQCSTAQQIVRPYVRSTTSDAIGFEQIELNDEFDDIESHPVECKCRSG